MVPLLPKLGLTRSRPAIPRECAPTAVQPPRAGPAWAQKGHKTCGAWEASTSAGRSGGFDSLHSTDRHDAVRLLTQRLADLAEGRPGGPDEERVPSRETAAAYIGGRPLGDLWTRAWTTLPPDVLYGRPMTSHSRIPSRAKAPSPTFEGNAGFTLCDPDQDGRRSRRSILIRHHPLGVVCLLLVGMQIPRQRTWKPNPPKSASGIRRR